MNEPRRPLSAGCVGAASINITNDALMAKHCSILWRNNGKYSNFTPVKHSFCQTTPVQSQYHDHKKSAVWEYFARPVKSRYAIYKRVPRYFEALPLLLTVVTLMTWLMMYRDCNVISCARERMNGWMEWKLYIKNHWVQPVNNAAAETVISALPTYPNIH